MNCIVPQPVWQSQDVYIIGGGPSLRDFDWNLLRGLNTIGCNDAYTLGVDICKVCLFGDPKWWEAHKDKLAEFKGDVYNICTRLNNVVPPWVQSIKRYAKGIQTDGIGWNGNTGFAAINLAILLGSPRIYLLGFDMKRIPLSQEELAKLSDVERQLLANWHPNELDKNPDSVYQKFLDWSKFLKKDWEEKYSHIEIINVTDDSALELFPKIRVDEFWQKRKTA